MPTLRARLVITVSQSGNMFSEDWSYQVGYDATTSRFVVSKFDYSTYDRVRMSGERAANDADLETVRLPARRVLFEDLDEKTGYDLLRF